MEMRPYAHLHMSPSRRLRALGECAPCMPIAAAVRDVVTHYLSPPDP
jgi:hypothetical protein